MPGKIHFIAPVNTSQVVPAVITDTTEKIKAHATHCKMAYFDVKKERVRTQATVDNFIEDFKIAVKQAKDLYANDKSSVIFVRGNNATGSHRNQWESVVRQLPVNMYEITYMVIDASERAQKLAFAHYGKGNNGETFKVWDQSCHFISVLPSELTKNAVYRCLTVNLYNDKKGDRGTPMKLTESSMENVKKFISGHIFKEKKSSETPPWAAPWKDAVPEKKTEVPVNWDDEVDSRISTSRRFASRCEGELPTSRRFESRWEGELPTSRRFESRWEGELPTSRRFASRWEDDVPTSNRFVPRCTDKLYEPVPTQKNFHPRGDVQSDDHMRIAQAITNTVMHRIKSQTY